MRTDDVSFTNVFLMCHHLCQFSFHIHINTENHRNHIVCSKRCINFQSFTRVCASCEYRVYTMYTVHDTVAKQQNTRRWRRKRKRKKEKTTKRYSLNTNRVKWRKKNEITRILPFTFCTAFAAAAAIIIIVVVVGFFYEHTHTPYYYVHCTLFFFSSVFHFRTMMSETQIFGCCCFEYQRLQIALHIIFVTPIDLISIWVCVCVV